MFETIYLFLRPFLNAILIGAIGVLIAIIVVEILRRILVRSMGAAWGRFLASLTGFAMLLWVIKIILDSTGSAGLVVVLVTAMTGAFAIGSESAAGDLVAGISLFVAKPYKEGDLVKLAEFVGKVEQVTLIATTLVGIDGDRIFVRNKNIADTPIINYSTLKGHRISVTIQIPAMQDLDKAIQVASDVIQKHSIPMDNEDLKPSVACENAAYGYVNMQVRIFTKDQFDYGFEQARLYAATVRALKEAGIVLER